MAQRKDAVKLRDAAAKAGNAAGVGSQNAFIEDIDKQLQNFGEQKSGGGDVPAGIPEKLVPGVPLIQPGSPEFDDLAPGQIFRGVDGKLHKKVEEEE